MQLKCDKTLPMFWNYVKGAMGLSFDEPSPVGMRIRNFDSPLTFSFLIDDVDFATK